MRNKSHHHPLPLLQGRGALYSEFLQSDAIVALSSVAHPTNLSSHWIQILSARLCLFCRCRGAVRLYSDFLQSDVIVASPLGLTTLLTEAAGAGDAGNASSLC